MAGPNDPIYDLYMPQFSDEPATDPFAEPMPPDEELLARSDAALVQQAQAQPEPVPEDTSFTGQMLQNAATGQPAPEPMPSGILPDNDRIEDIDTGVREIDPTLMHQAELIGELEDPTQLRQDVLDYENMSPGAKLQIAKFDEQKRMNEEQQAALEEHAARTAEREARLQSEIDQIQQYKPWHDRVGTGNRVGAIIGAALSGFLGGDEAGQSWMNTLQKTIDRDLQMQQLEIGKRMKDLQAQYASEGRVLDAQLQTDLAMSKLYSAAYQDVYTQAVGEMDKAQTAQARRQAEQMALKAKQEAEKNRLEAAHKQAQIDKLNAETAKLQGRGGAGAGAGATQETGLIEDPLVVSNVLTQEEADTSRGKRVVALPVTNSGGKKQSAALVLDDRIADDLNKRGDAFESALSLMPRLAKSVRGSSKTDINTKIAQTKKGAQIATEYSKLLLKFKEIENLGVLNGKDLDILKDITGQDANDILNMTRGEIMTNLRTLYELTAEDLQRRVSRGTGGLSTYEVADFDSVVGKAPGSVVGHREVANIHEAALERGTLQQKQEANQQVYDIYSKEGINVENIDEAREAMERLYKQPKEARNLPVDPGATGKGSYRPGEIPEIDLADWLANEIANYEQAQREKGDVDTASGRERGRAAYERTLRPLLDPNNPPTSIGGGGR